MNTIEDRLRDALRERARHSPIDPDAWEQTVARVRRPVRARAWSRFIVPVAAAAAVVAIVAGATVLTGHEGLGAGPGLRRPALRIRPHRRRPARATTSSSRIRRSARSSGSR